MWGSNLDWKILFSLCRMALGRFGDGMQTAALADCERLRTNRRHA